MPRYSMCFQFLLLLLASSLQSSHALKSAVFLSPAFELEPGSVANKFYYGIDFPTAHIAVKAFDAEVVDEEGNPVPLHETYLHHWVVDRFYQRKGVDIKSGFHESDSMVIRNSGICENTLGQYYGLGSETRKTRTDVPDPYGIVAGNPEEVPEGYEEKWLMNVHAIDTRGTEDRFGCAECRCDLYNVTIDEYGRTLGPGYVGGLFCCYDEMKCRLKKEFWGVKRKLFMRYTVKWVDFDESVVPVKIYILDVTDLWKKKKMDDPNGEGTRHLCLVEYNVESCTNDGGDCTDTKRVSLRMPTGGVVIYGVAHQHTGGIGSALYGEDGRVICTSKPTYGKGKEVGDEEGYIVGMSTCYPRPGSVNISDGEILVFESNYSSTRKHTGVMGLFYLLVADHGSSSSLPTTNSIHDSNDQKHEKAGLFVGVWGVAFLGAVIAMAVAVTYRRKEERNDGYQSIVI